MRLNVNPLVYFTYHLGGSPSWMAFGPTGFSYCACRPVSCADDRRECLPPVATRWHPSKSLIDAAVSVFDEANFFYHQGPQTNEGFAIG